MPIGVSTRRVERKDVTGEVRRERKGEGTERGGA